MMKKWRRLRFFFRWLVRSDTNGSNPAYRKSFDEWAEGWEPALTYGERRMMEVAWLQAQGRFRFKS